MDKNPDKQWSAYKKFCMTDLFFLGYFVCNLPLNHPFLIDRCNDIQDNPDGYIDLWSREHWKSSIITFLRTMQDIFNDPEVTIGILSYRASIAQAFLFRIMNEFESNQILKKCFSEILWDNPRSQAPKWSLENGITVKRKSNPTECTIEAYGMIDGMPTSKHFQILLYEDVVTKDAVKTETSIKDVTNSWELSLNLTSERPGKPARKRYIGTRYHRYDTYKTIMDRKAAVPRIFPATDNGKFDGKPVYWTQEVLEQKIKEMGKTTFSAQCLQDPVPPGEEKFSESMLNYWPATNFNGLNVYILCDPANAKKKGSDYTVFIVLGLGYDQNYYIIDIIRDRLDLTERANVLFKLHRDYRPIRVGYEQYGMVSDITHFKEKMNRDNYRFHIDPLGAGSFGSMAKNDRIDTLEPDFQNGKIYLPERIIHVNYEGKKVDMVQAFIQEEYLPYPYGEHDDMMDCLARKNDPKFPMTFPNQTVMDGTGVPFEVIMEQQRRNQPQSPLNILEGMQGQSPLQYRQ